MRSSWLNWLMAIGLFLGITMVWGLARWIDPYDAEGAPKMRSTHEQLGLPPCRFLQLTGRPCPSCGLTTSFALLAHGDPRSAFRANLAGPFLGFLSLWLWIWSFLCLVRRKVQWTARQELLVLIAFGLAFCLLMGHWFWILVLG